MNTIIFLRENNEQINSLRNIEVFFDNQNFLLSNGESKSINIENGDYYFYFKLDNIKSKIYKVEAKDNHNIKIKVSFFVTFKNKLLFKLFLIFQLLMTIVVVFYEKFHYTIKLLIILHFCISLIGLLYFVYYFTLNRKKYFKIEQL